MVVRKILEATLVAGSTSVTFTDTDIPNSLLRVYCSRSALFPISQTLSGNSVTVNYKPQDSNIGVALEIVKNGLDIVDDLTTEDNTKALSANQGYVLKGLIDDIVIPTVPENITDLDDVDVTDIANGQVLAWNSTTEKFENVNQSGGDSSVIYSTSEQLIGKWTDDSDLYERTFLVPFSSLTTDNQFRVFNTATILSGVTVRAVDGLAISATYGICKMGERNFRSNTQSGAFWEYISYYGYPALLSSTGINDLNNSIKPDLIVTFRYTKNV